jgi:hypothetical protein
MHRLKEAFTHSLAPVSKLTVSYAEVFPDSRTFPFAGEGQRQSAERTPARDGGNPAGARALSLVSNSKQIH